MGFTTGFLSSITLTTLTLTLLSTTHIHNRHRQSDLLRQQSLILNSLASPPSSSTNPYPLPSDVQEEQYERRFRYPGQSGGIAELVKERWNREVEGFVKNVVGRGPEFGGKVIGVVEGLGRRAWTAAGNVKDKTEDNEEGKEK